MKTILYIFLIASFLLFLFSTFRVIKKSNKATDETDNVILGQKMPKISKSDILGNPYPFKKNIRKTLVLVYVDNLTCSSCKKSLLFLKELYYEYIENSDFVFLAIIGEKNIYNILRFKKLNQLPFQIIADPEKKIRQSLNITISPYKMIVKNNVVIFVQNGYKNRREDALKFKEILASQNPKQEAPR